MIQLNMSLAKHNELRAMYGGVPTGIHKELEKAGFDMERDWSTGRDKGTGDLIFMQAEPEPEAPPEPKKKAVKFVAPKLVDKKVKK